jgi:hypothetical protein
MVFCSVFRQFVSDTTKARIFFFCRTKREFFFQYLTLGYVTKILNQNIFFLLHQNQNIFFSNIGNQVDEHVNHYTTHANSQLSITL